MPPHEALLQHLRHDQHQPAGRVHLRARTTIEHSLARVQHIQGPKARSKGLRKNTLAQRVARLPVAA